MAATGFVRAAHSDILIMGSTLEELLAAMESFQPPHTVLQMRASEL
jgi:hypothetical protein